MKIVLFPYLTKNTNNNWTSNVVFYNNSDRKALINFEYEGDSAFFSQSEKINSKQRYIFSPPQDGMYSLKCLLAEDVFVSGLIFGSGGLTTADQEEISISPSNSSAIETIPNDSQLYELNGNTYCRYLQKRWLECIKFVIFNSQCEDVSKHKTSILDACPITGTCPNHPGSSHSDSGDAIDLEYYKIDNTLPFNHNTNFDVARQWRLFSDLIALNKNVYFHISDLIKAPLLSYLSGRTDDINLLHSYTHVDIGTTYNHHLHVHVMWRS